MKHIVLAVALAATASQLGAATVNVYSTATTQNNSTTPTSLTDTNFLNNQSTTVQSGYSVNASSTLAQTTASSSALADGDTGVMRATSSVSGSNFDGTGNGSTNASVVIRETYSLSGTGIFTASLLLDGTWDVSRSNGTPFWQVQSSVALNPNTGNPIRDFVCIGIACGPSISSANTGSVSGYLLSVSQAFDTSNIFAPNSVVVQFDLLTQLATANGLLDFGNTAKLLVETSGSLVATPSDPDFISNPAFNQPTAIPLPAGFVLMLTALSGFVLTGRRRRA